VTDIFKKKNELGIGFSRGLSDGRASTDELSPAERKLLERIAERLIAEHGETLEKLRDE
jgi:hypothetical protein